MRVTRLFVGLFVPIFAALAGSERGFAAEAETVADVAARVVDNASGAPRVPEVRDLSAISLQAGSSNAPIWNEEALIYPKPAGGARIVPPKTIIPGKFAHAHFTGPEASWVGFDTLVLEVESPGAGQLAIGLTEDDGGQRENYSLLLDRLEPGKRSLRFRLARAPQGDLRPAGLTRDGGWNPDEEKGVRLILADYPPGLVIAGMRLEQSAELEEGTER